MDVIDEKIGEETPAGEVFGRLIDAGKDYARAELDLLRARAEGHAGRAKLPGLLGVGAIAFGFAAIIALVLTMVLALASLLGPLGGGLIAVFIALAIAGGLALAAVKSWKAGA